MPIQSLERVQQTIEILKRKSRSFGILQTGDTVEKGPPGPKPDIYGDDVVWDDDAAGGRGHWVKQPQNVQRDTRHLPVSRYESRQKATEQYRNSPDIQDVGHSRGATRYYNFEYKDLNQALRDGGELSYGDQEIYEGMKETMKPTQQQYEVWRGWRNNPDYAHWNIGDEKVSPQFTSTTLDSHYAVEWMGFNSSTGDVIKGNPLWKITVPEGTSAIMPRGVSNDYEVELTLDSNVKFRCVDIEHGEFKIGGDGEQELYGNSIYHMEVVPEIVAVNKLLKAPPGPPPRPGLVWYEGTHRWRRPKELTGSELSMEHTAEFNNELDSYMIAAKKKIGGRINVVNALIRDGVRNAQTAFKDHDQMNMMRKQRAIKQSFAKMKEVENGIIEWWPKEHMKEATPVMRMVRRRMATLENIDHKINEEVLDIQLSVARDYIGSIATKAGGDKKLRARLGKVEKQFKASEKYMEYGDIENSVNSLDKAFDVVQDMLDSVNESDVQNTVESLRQIVNSTANELDIAMLPFPTRLPDRQISTGKPLEIGKGVDIDSWEVPVHIGWEHMYRKEADIARKKVSSNLKKIASNLKPELQQTFMDWVEKYGTVVHRVTDWDDVVKGHVGKSAQGNEVLGYALKTGIHVPENAAAHTIVHEFGHMVDLSYELDEDTSAWARVEYHDRYHRHTLAETSITEYATTNEREFFAEYFEEYLLNPENLYLRDVKMYKVMRDGLFQ